MRLRATSELSAVHRCGVARRPRKFWPRCRVFFETAPPCLAAFKTPSLPEFDGRGVHAGVVRELDGLEVRVPALVEVVEAAAHRVDDGADGALGGAVVSRGKQDLTMVESTDAYDAASVETLLAGERHATAPTSRSRHPSPAR